MAESSVLSDVPHPQTDTSPRKQTTGMVQNFFALQPPSAQSSHTAIKDELVNKIAFDDSRVFIRLGIDHVSSHFVTNCTATFRTNRQLIEARSILQNAIVVESLRTVADEELEEKHTTQGVFGEKPTKTVSESKMYKPLATIFKHIQDFPDSSQSSASPKNFLIKTSTTTLKADASTWGFPNYSPDFILFEGKPQNKDIFWRNSLGFCEVKPTLKHSPQSSNPKVVKPLVCQAADYARLHLSARPFHLFSVALLIFGPQFCVAIFDRAGVLFSPIHDMWTETEIFVRVIRSLTCLLSPTKLGQDPTVSKLSDVQHRERYVSEITRLGRDIEAEDFPTYVIMAGGRNWYTVGLPLWTSVSLLGRGTSIWLVQENGSGTVFVLKNTWRSAARLSESEIYGAITGSHPAVAKLLQGGDVFFPDEERRITTHNLRGASTASEVDVEDVCLHRLLLESRGRPLWEYTSEKELLQGMRAALNGHKFLCDQGILHRDISAGNIMLPAGDSPEPGAEGFLMDLEFARIGRSLDVVTKTNVPPVRAPGGRMTAEVVRSHTTFGPAVLRGAAMTGTAQFMAYPILEAVVQGYPIKHEPHHDLESFIYVLAYTIARRAILESQNLDDDLRYLFHKEFNATFANMTFMGIRDSRGSKQPLRLVHKSFPAQFSEPMVALFKALDTYLGLTSFQASDTQTIFQVLKGSSLNSTDAMNFSNHLPINLTHEQIIFFLDEAIAKMS